jgi:BirA family transcriptional regulator, biotin operon repressor / biotin---[acetyl-CoA-carboxylase] ligase
LSSSLPSSQDLQQRLGLPRVEWRAEVGSTLDLAHELAASGAPAGTLVVADAQTSGRGRQGRRWHSEPGAGLWLTMIERPSDPGALEVLSLRIGLALAEPLDAFAESPVRLKWPNDLYVGSRKLGGILVEARWRNGHVEWVAIGVGINVRAPAGEPQAIGLRPGADRLEVLERIVPRLRAAAAKTGRLDESELAQFAARDLAAGRKCSQPAAGTVQGIDASGALLVAVAYEGTPRVIAVRAGSLVLTEAW